MLQHLGTAAREARESRGRHQVQIAAEIGVDQATIRNFEHGKHWPRNPDAMIGAYAQDLGIPVVDLWADALGRMRKATVK